MSKNNTVRLSSSEKIHQARMALRKSSKSKQIEVMVKAGVLTEEEAARAKEKLTHIMVS